MYYKFNEECLLVLLLVQFCSSDTDSKRWVWSDARRRSDDRPYTGVVNNDRKYTGEIGGTVKPLFQPASNFGNNFQSSSERQRYEVLEGQYNRPSGSRPPIRPPEQYRPDRPIAGIRPIPDFNRPNDLGGSSFNRPNGGNNYRPRPIENEYRPGGNGYRPNQGDFNRPNGGYRPVNGPNGKPILTGPVPSWEQHNPNRYKDYDKCKCVHSFNCNSPGIKFGTCDVDKQYCCYKGGSDYPGGIGIDRPGGIGIDRPGGIGIDRPGGTGIDRPINPNTNYDRNRPVLAGPGGPIDGPGRPFQNKFGNNRPFRPFSDIDRYGGPDRNRDDNLDEAYKKGLASAIFELYNRPDNYNDRDYQGYRDYYRDDRDYRYENIYKPYRQESKYGLYDPLPYDNYYGRSANSTILSTKKV